MLFHRLGIRTMFQILTLSRRLARVVLIVGTLGLAAGGEAPRSLAAEQPNSAILRSARSGPWSAPATWEAGKVPAAGGRVHIRPGHTVVYDVHSTEILRCLHI